jgi:hypothetical protein
MDNTAQTSPKHTKTVTRSEWRAKHRDFKSGDPRKGTATMTWYEPGVGSVLGAVTVVPDPPAAQDDDHFGEYDDHDDRAAEVIR